MKNFLFFFLSRQAWARAKFFPQFVMVNTLPLEWSSSIYNFRVYSSTVIVRQKKKNESGYKNFLIRNLKQEIKFSKIHKINVHHIILSTYNTKKKKNKCKTQRKAHRVLSFVLQWLFSRLLYMDIGKKR